MAEGSVRILAISGSLRRQSSNTALLRAAQAMARPRAQVTLYRALADIAAFNPDHDETPPAPVAAFRRLVGGHHGVLICSPEYAHGIAGALKNALDWLVGSGELYAKPTALLNAAVRAAHAQAGLKEVVTTMDARLVADVGVRVPLAGRSLETEDVLRDPDLAGPLQSALSALLAACTEPANRASST